MQDKNDHRATFKVLLEFIERQSRAMLDPVFGDIHTSADTKRVSKPKQQKTVKPSGRPSFATTVAQVSAPKRNDLQSGHKQKLCAAERSCLFCAKNHTFESCETFKTKPNGEKIEFLKTNGMCFGCLTKGHISKICKNRMKCEMCSMLHPTILHIPTEKEKDKVKGDNVQAGSKNLSNAMVSVNDSDPMGPVNQPNAHFLLCQ